MSGTIPYVIAFNGRIVGKIYGQAIAISANCINVPAPTTQRYLTLNFPSASARNIRGLRLAWRLLHQEYRYLVNPSISRDDYIDAFAILYQLGVPDSTWLTLVDRVPKGLSPFPPRRDDLRVEARKREILQLLFRGAHYLTPITVGRTRQVIYGSLSMMGHISKFFARLVDRLQKDHLPLDDASVIPPVLSTDVVTSEIWNTWLVMNGGLMVKASDPQVAWWYISYFGIDLAHPYVNSTLARLIDLGLANTLLAPSVVKDLLSVPIGKRKALMIFHATGSDASPAERFIYRVAGEARGPISYPYSNYCSVNADRAAELVSHSGIYLMDYGTAAEAKTGLYPRYHHVVSVASHPTADEPLNQYVVNVEGDEYFIEVRGQWNRVQNGGYANTPTVLVHPPVILYRQCEYL